MRLSATFTTIGLMLGSLPLPPARAGILPDLDLSRSGQWEVNYDQDSCHLIAAFGEGDDQVVASFDRYQPSSGFDLVLYGRPLRLANQYYDVMVDFGPTRDPHHALALVGDSAGLPVLILGGQRLDDWRSKKTNEKPPEITSEQEARATSLNVTGPVDRTGGITLGLGAMDAPMRALRSCTSNLVGRWGYNPRVMAALKSPPVPTNDPREWLSYADFPGKKIVAAANAVVHFRLDINAEGGVAGCRILQSTDADFADLSCRLIAQRAKFKPAIDSNGNPIRAYWVTKILWLGGTRFGG